MADIYRCFVEDVVHLICVHAIQSSYSVYIGIICVYKYTYMLTTVLLTLVAVVLSLLQDDHQFLSVRENLQLGRLS